MNGHYSYISVARDPTTEAFYFKQVILVANKFIERA